MRELEMARAQNPGLKRHRLLTSAKLLSVISVIHMLMCVGECDGKLYIVYSRRA